jgi:maltooligosyltrehalose trehalohydrolase
VVWAPSAHDVAIAFVDSGGRDTGSVVPLRSVGGGYVAGDLGMRSSGERYWVELDGARVADPASRAQPDGVFGPSALFDPGTFPWGDGSFRAPDLERFVCYELHIGTFRAPIDRAAPGGRRPGTFASAAAAFAELVDLGVTAVEVMPVASFSGARNWGYDGVFPFAVQESYGGPEGLQGFVDAAHRAGLAVVLDVVYNHFGPEGAVLNRFGPYTSDAYTTAWGPAVNVDRADSDEVRRFLIENACWWLREFHIDALRLDAIHGIIDTSARPFLAELADEVAALSESLGRPLLLIAESEDNNPRVLRSTTDGGYGMDGVWADDFHHALHVALTGEHQGYYADYQGTPELARAIAEGFAYTGQYSRYRRRRHGAPPVGTRPARFTVAAQNHDQVGNRPGSERFGTLLSPARCRVAAGVLCCSPGVPLLFMGEEYGERHPFAYFVDHTDPDLLAAVRRGRAEEMGAEGTLDPGAPETFALSCCAPEEAGPTGEALRSLYRGLLRLRRAERIVTDPDATTTALGWTPVLTVERRGTTGGMWFAANTGADDVTVDLPAGSWRCVVDTEGEGGFDGGDPGGDAHRVRGPASVVLRGESFVCYLEEASHA